MYFTETGKMKQMCECRGRIYKRPGIIVEGEGKEVRESGGQEEDWKSGNTKFEII